MSIGPMQCLRCNIRSCHGNGYPPQSRELIPSYCELIVKRHARHKRLDFVAYLPDERLDAAGTTVDLVKSDLANYLVAMLSAMHVSACCSIS
jgi:hypothetical protein